MENILLWFCRMVLHFGIMLSHQGSMMEEHNMPDVQSLWAKNGVRELCNKHKKQASICQYNLANTFRLYNTLVNI